MATLEQIQARITRLQDQAKVLRVKQNRKVIAQIFATMKKHDLTLEDLSGAASTKGTSAASTNGTGARRGRPPKAASAAAPAAPSKAKVAKKSGLPAKYRNPETGETWSGWARPPAWIRDVEDRTQFLIDPTADTTVTLGPRKTAGVKKAVTNATKGTAGAKKTARRGRKSKTVS